MVKSNFRIWYGVVCVALSWSCGNVVEGRRGVGSTEQDWGHVAVRPHAHMFWWLYYTTANVSSYTERPLIVWLQGGPGMPSSGYGNFLEIGPLQLNFTEREHTWVKDFNVLFVDNPVGVGFSYFSDDSAKMVQNNDEIGADLVVFVRRFLEKFRDLQKVPMYIFGESYGGKMATELAYQLKKEINKGSIVANLKGIGLGDAYISPLHYILNYASFAVNLGLVDKKGHDEIQGLTRQVQAAIAEGDFETASDIEARVTETVVRTTQGIDVYNIVLKSNLSAIPRFLSHQNQCNLVMNTRIKHVLNISKDIDWSYINDDIYCSLQGDLMRPVTDTIEALLNETDIKVIVYNGVFDFLVNTAGTAMWLDNLKWKNRSEWQEAPKHPLEINMVNEGYVKQIDNLVFYTILRAGHSVPIDNIPAMEELLKRELLQVKYVL